jgi:hypothetical protein
MRHKSLLVFSLWVGFKAANELIMMTDKIREKEFSWLSPYAEFGDENRRK